MTSTPTIRGATVSDELAIIHEGWMEQVATFLLPVLTEEADFWSRWAGARFLSDQFGGRFRLECALLDALGPRLSEEAAHTIAEVRAALERTAEELVAAGRRRASGMVTAVLARRFIDQMGLWCVEVELATDRIQAGDLTDASAAALSALRTSQYRPPTAPHDGG
jgi:hypothetical protein